MPSGLDDGSLDIKVEKKKTANKSWAESTSYVSTTETRYSVSQTVASNDLDDELKVSSSRCNQSISREHKSDRAVQGRKLNKKEKLSQQKKRLQVMLEEDSRNISPSKNESGYDSSDDNADEFLENVGDLLDEGVYAKRQGRIVSQRPKYISQPALDRGAPADVKVRLCPRCSRAQEGTPESPIAASDNASSFFKPVKKNQFDTDVTDDDDFDSVSQIDRNKPFQPKWPVITDTEDESVAELRLDRNESPASREREVNFDLGDDKSEKSEFFEKNAPQRGSPLKWIEEKPGRNSPVPRKPSIKTPKQAWKQQIAETGSEAEPDEDESTNVTPKQGSGWRQKSVLTDDASEL